MPYWLPFFSRSSRYDVEIMMEMVALIWEYATYKNITTNVCFLAQEGTRGSLVTPEKRSESHSMP